MSRCLSEGDWRAYLDREMPVDEMARAEAHRNECGKCAALHQEVSRRAGRVSMLMADLPAVAGVVRQRVPEPRHAWRWAVPAMALAAGLFYAWLLPREPVRVPVVKAPRIPSMNAAPVIAATVGVKRPVKRRVLSWGDPPVDIPASNEFFALDNDPIETAVIVRVGVDNGLAQADVMVGPDGRAHAVRMVAGNSGE